jgi:signal transduction histidine kinase
VVCLSTSTRAIDPERAMSQYIRDRWGADKGFPGGAVHGITQTDDGYLWIAAEKGLVRFDGFAFRLVEPLALTSDASPTVLDVVAEPGGGLWARLRGPALLRYRDGVFENMGSSLNIANSVSSAMSGGNDGAVFVAALGRGVVAYRGGRASAVAPPASMPSSFVIAIAETPDGDVWMGTRDSGLLRAHAQHVTEITRGLPDQKINCLLPGDGGDLWIGTDSGVVRWNGTEITTSGLPAALGRVRALAMIRDRDANTWIATASDGLLRVNGKGVAHLVDRDEKSPATVTAVFEDRDGDLWIGTTRGLERLREGVFATFSTAQGLPSDSVGPVYVDAGGRTWFGAAEGGLFWMRDGDVGRVTQAGLAEDVIYSIAGDGNEIWVGRQKGGLTHLAVNGDAMVARRFTQADGLAQNNIYAVQQTRDGAVWAGTLSGGVSRFKAGVFTTYTKADGLASNTVASILETAAGTMWFATPNGVSVLSRGGWRSYSTADGLPSNDVNTLIEDSTGRVWAGTAAGLAVIHAGQLRPAARVPASLRGSILGLADDRTGYLWIATADRVLRVNREHLELGVLGEQDVREYGVADGLLGLEGVKRHRTVAVDPRGRIWIAMNRGLSMANARRAAGRASPALAHIEDVSADGTALDVRSALRIPSGRRRITLAYTGLSLSVPERVMFRYRLDGFDHEWSAPVFARQAVYTNLGPGPYRFRVMASNSEGVWDGAEAAIGFDIEPTFWQTRSFQLSVVLLAAVAGWAVYRLRVMQVARQLNVRFEERLAERTRIAQELHDTLLQGFLSASMQLHVATDRLPADSPIRSSLGKVLDLMGRVIDEGRNAVRGLRSSTSADDLEQALSGIPAELAIPEHVSYRVIVEGKARALNPVIRDEVYRIGREALVNAFRHSGAHAVEVELDYASNHLRMLVRDNGHGIDQAVLVSGSDGHWGLPGMRERAERIGARFKVFSRADAGTEVELSVPGAVAFTMPDAGRRSGKPEKTS